MEDFDRNYDFFNFISGTILCKNYDLQEIFNLQKMNTTLPF